MRLKLLSYFTLATRGMSTEAPILSEAEEELVDEEVVDEEDQSDAPYVEKLTVANKDYDPALVLELGDRIIIDSEAKGLQWGTVYYRDNDLLRLKPDMGNTLIDYPRDYDVEEGIDQFTEELGVKVSHILKKRNPEYPDFVRQQDFQVDQTLVGIERDGKQGAFYKITKVKESKDYIKMYNIDEPGEEIKLEFKFMGIPEDAPFHILRIVAPPGVDLKVEAEKARKEAAEAIGVPAIKEQVQEQPDDADEDEEVLAVDDEFEIEDEGYVVVPQEEVLKEVGSSSKIIPDNLQRADAINDFLNMLPVADRKNERNIRKQRILVETLNYMKRSIIDYQANGTVKGINRPSASTLYELINKVEVPMGRAVLDVKKRLFKEFKGRIQEDLDADLEDGARDQVYRKYDENEFLEARTNTFASAIIQSSTGFVEQNNYYTQSQETYGRERPWKAENEGPLFEIRKDMQFFRADVPDFNENAVIGYDRVAPGLGKSYQSYLKEKETPPYPSIGSLPYGLETALTTTYRKGIKGQTVVFLEDESAPLKFYMLFPEQEAPYIGTTRSGSVALDMMRSKQEIKSMKTILESLSPIQEVNRATGIVLFGMEGGNLSANIPITDYLEGLVILGLGIGDMLIDLGNYGLNQLEFTPAILEVLNAKITVYQGHLKTVLNTLREALPEIPAAQPSPMLPLDTPVLNDFLNDKENPILVNSIKTFELQNPTLKLSDIARVAHLLKYFGDYWQVVIGKQVAFIVEARNRVIKTNQLERIQNEETIKRNRENRGVPPQPNTCEHVAKLVTIRKIRDDAERFSALTKFLAHYQGSRLNNYITCNVCSKELLCVHERLLIKAFLSPLEKEVVYKELNLHFSGGIFQGYYICRSCGQPIQELEYDTNIEFDDQGKPKIGRAVLKDKDALTAEDIERVLSVPLKKSDEYEFADNDQMIYYRIVRELAERVGIYMDKKSYKRVIKNLQGLLELYPSREDFIKSEKAYKKKKEEKGEKYTIKDYDTVIAKKTICSAAILLLYEIQSHIPDYVPQYSLPGCDAGFGGYPLEENRESLQGITYMACAIAAIAKDDVPWSTAGLYKPVKGGKKEDQLASILKEMRGPMEDIRDNFLNLEQKLIEKRIFKIEQLGIKTVSTMTRPRDTVPNSFLPELVLPTVAKAAAEPVTGLDARAVAKAWIRNAHALARDNSKPVRGSPFSDITCCKVSVAVPGGFWSNKADLSPVPLLGRSMRPLQRAPAQIFHFVERVPDVLVVEIPKDLTYRLFLSVCYKGPRFGLPHEPGYTNLCHSCGFQFPTHPSVIDPDEAKTAISKQNIDTNLETFQTLLTSVQNHNQVDPYFLGEPEEWVTTMRAIRDLKYPPVDNWGSIFKETIRALNKLDAKGDYNRGNIAEILAETGLDEAAENASVFVKAAFATKIDKKLLRVNDTILDNIAGLPWHNFIQVLETYFIKVGKNFLYQFNSESLTYTNDKLASVTLSDIARSIAVDNSILNAFKDEFNTKEMRMAHRKLLKFVLQLSEIARFKNRIRPSYFVGGKITFEYIQKCFFYGPLQDLFNPDDISFNENDEALNDLPGYAGVGDDEEEDEEEEDESVPVVKKTAKKTSAASSIGDRSISFLVKIINFTIANFMKYQLSYNDNELKQELEMRAEKEKQGMLSSLDKMNDEDRRIYKMQMKLGIGRFGVNVRKEIINYSKDQVELEARLNKEAGIVTSLSGPDFGNEMDNEGFEGEQEDENEDQRELNEGYDYEGALGDAADFEGEED